MLNHWFSGKCRFLGGQVIAPCFKASEHLSHIALNEMTSSTVFSPKPFLLSLWLFIWPPVKQTHGTRLPLSDLGFEPPFPPLPSTRLQKAWWASFVCIAELVRLQDSHTLDLTFRARGQNLNPLRLPSESWGSA